MTEGATATAIECLDSTLDVVDQTVEEQQQQLGQDHQPEGTTILELNLLKAHKDGEEQQVAKMTQNKVCLRFDWVSKKNHMH